MSHEPDPGDLTAWLNALPDDAHDRVVSLAREYASAVASTAPLHDMWLLERGLINVLLEFHAEIIGVSSGLPPRSTRATPWSA